MISPQPQKIKLLHWKHKYKSFKVEQLCGPMNMCEQASLIVLSTGTTGVAKRCEITTTSIKHGSDSLFIGDIFEISRTIHKKV